MVIFGNSRVMFGINAKTIAAGIAQTGGSYEAVNLAGADQDIFESSYYYALVDSPVKVVVQFTTAGFLARDSDHKIEDYKCIPMYLGGYRINTQTETLLPNYNPYFNRPEMVNLFEARSYIRSYIFTFLQAFFDNEPKDLSRSRSLYFPHIYESDKSPDYPVQEYNCGKFKPTETPAKKFAFLKKVSAYFSKKNIQYIVVFMPVNTDECKDAHKYAAKYSEQLKQKTGIAVIDLTGFLPSPEYYYDAFHMNKKGAEIVSAEVAKQLNLIINPEEKSSGKTVSEYVEQ